MFILIAITISVWSIFRVCIGFYPNCQLLLVFFSPPLTEMDIMFETDGDSNTFTTEKTFTNGTQETEHEDSDKQTSDDPSMGRRRSWIWSHFESFDGSARCRICSERLQACKGGSTGNMHRHMSAKHPEVLKTPISYSARKRSSSGNDVYTTACLKWVHQESGDSCWMKSSR